MLSQIDATNSRFKKITSRDGDFNCNIIFGVFVTTMRVGYQSMIFFIRKYVINI